MANHVLQKKQIIIHTCEDKYVSQWGAIVRDNVPISYREWKGKADNNPHMWGPCVVRGPVDGHFLVWWVIDNVVWTDSWLSIAGAGCGLTSIGAGEEQVRKVVAGEASRCGEDK
jgi:hypothetical protein